MSGCRNAAGRLFQILTRSRETPIPKANVCLRDSENGVSRAKLAASRVRDQLAVVDQIRWSLTARLVDESGQLVVDSLFDRQPVQVTKNR